MILLFHYQTPVGDSPGSLGDVFARFNTEEELDGFVANTPMAEGEYVAYQAKGRTGERDVAPRFEFLKYVTVSPPPPVVSGDVSTSKKF